MLFGRRQLPALTRAKVSQRVSEDLSALTADDFRGAQDIFVALGTTISKAGSQEEFRRVDLELPLHLASEAARAGLERLVLVSSVGADPGSKIFYLRSMGELEQALAALPFKAINILRPSLLVGKRAEFRLGESVVMAIAPALDLLTLGPWRRYHSVKATVVGRAMVGAAQQVASGTRVYEYNEIVRLAAAVA